MESSNRVPKDRVLTIEKTFNAPIDLVWDAWTDPEHIAYWWGPKGMKINVEIHEFKEGGKWKYSMPMPDGNHFITEGVYTTIVEKQKIVTTADFKPMTEGVILEILFEADGDQTHFVFNVIHETAEYAKQQEKMGFFNGWGSVFNNLGTYLEDLQ